MTIAKQLHTYTGKTSSDWQTTNFGTSSDDNYSIIATFNSAAGSYYDASFINRATNNGVSKWHLKLHYMNGSYSSAPVQTYEWKQSVHPFTSADSVASPGAQAISPSTHTNFEGYMTLVHTSKASDAVWDLNPTATAMYNAIGVLGSNNYPTNSSNTDISASTDRYLLEIYMY